MIAMRREGKSLDEIGAQFGVTRERVRQILVQYGGPTAREVRAHNEARRLAAERETERRVALALTELLIEPRPMTVEQASRATGIATALVSQYWPISLIHLKLWDAPPVDRRWSEDDIAEILRQAAIFEYPLTTSAYDELLRKGEVQGPSIPRIGQIFGSWSAACDFAGVMYGRPRPGGYDSKWSDEDLLQVVRRYLADPDAPNSLNGYDSWKSRKAPDGPSGSTLRNRFGSWTLVKMRAITGQELTSE